MKSLSLLFALLITGLFLDTVCADRVQAGEIWDSSGLATVSGSSFPALHSMALVWQARGGLAGAVSGDADWEIFYCDLDSLQVVQLTDDDSDDTLPQTDGEYVVWQKYDSEGGNRIYLHRLAGGTPAGGVMISPADGSDNQMPKIAAGHVVWTSQVVTDSYRPGRIMLYEAGGQQAAMVISDPAADCGDPRVDARRAVWLQTNTDGTVSHWYCDLTADVPQAAPVPERFVFNRSPAMDGPVSVLTRRDGTDSEIFLYSRGMGFSRMTDNIFDDRAPVISQNHIAWVAGGQIHVAEISSFIQVPGLKAIGFWGNSFLAGWEPLSGGVDTYLLDLSTDPGFSSFVPGYHDLDVGDVTEADLVGLSPEVTYYLRIRAVVNGELTAYSPVVTIRLGRSRPEATPGRRPNLSPIYRLLLR